MPIHLHSHEPQAELAVDPREPDLRPLGVSMMSMLLATGTGELCYGPRVAQRLRSPHHNETLVQNPTWHQSQSHLLADFHMRSFCAGSVKRRQSPANKGTDGASRFLSSQVIVSRCRHTHPQRLAKGTSSQYYHASPRRRGRSEMKFIHPEKAFTNLPLDIRRSRLR